MSPTRRDFLGASALTAAGLVLPRSAEASPFIRVVERSEPVSTCNIQTDATGQVRPGAKMVGAQAGVALPVLDASGEVRAVVGIAYKEERTLLESELAALARESASLP